MRKSIVIVLHFIFWACYIILIAIVLGVYYRDNPGASNPEFRVENALRNIFLFAFAPSIVVFYLFYFILFPKYLQQENFVRAVAYGLLMCVATAIVSYIVHRYFIETGRVLDMDEGGKNGRSTAVRTIMVTTIIELICGTAALVMKGFITWFDEIKLKALLKEKNYEMEMALIKSQLDPHLLFNTINNIDALILKDQVEASNYLNKLSDIMRFMLYETKADKILLSREIEYIEKYIALHKIRTANTEYVHFAVTGIIGSKMVAPMIFIPFIENAFKHVNNKKVKNAISIDIFIREHNIQLICENKYDPKFSVKQADSGLGNELIEKRLNLIYPGKHTLEIEKKDDLYSVNLTIING
ncbi:MAG: histidine kinase [Sphingobacteriaceae bacterium]|nr:histidine kinase [Sphingobacteriaceae bacterium]